MPFWKLLLAFQIHFGYAGLLQTVAQGAGRLCDGKNGCCAGYTWNEALQTCKKCAIGYYGADCEEPCVYPYYGENCNGNCKCFQQYCNISVGCLYQKTSSVDWQPDHNGTTQINGFSSDLGSNLTDSSPHNQTSSDVYVLPYDFGHIVIYVCIGGFSFAVIVIVTNCLFYRHAVRRFYSVSINDGDRNLASSKFKQSKNKIFEGNATMTMFYNNETDSYHVEIRTTNHQTPTDTEYLKAEKTNRDREAKPVYESLQDDMKLTLRTLSRCPHEHVINDASNSPETGSECDTTVKEVTVASDSPHNEHQHRDVTNQNVYLAIY